VLDLLLPRRCVVCASAGTQLCVRCLERLPRIEPPLCERCGAPTAWPVVRCRDCAGRRISFAKARAAVVYDDTVRSLVAAWKQRGLRRLAETAADVVVEVLPRPSAQLTYVPADPDRGLRRGHEPPRRLAEALGARWQLPLAPMLRRSRAARPQRGLTRAERRRNVAAVFSARTAPREVVLVDDVLTSGATANAAALALRKAGARRVEIVTFARVVR
jgi:predicted amidophosphoribosyltransferase